MIKNYDHLFWTENEFTIVFIRVPYQTEKMLLKRSSWSSIDLMPSSTIYSSFGRPNSIPTIVQTLVLWTFANIRALWTVRIWKFFNKPEHVFQACSPTGLFFCNKQPWANPPPNIWYVTRFTKIFLMLPTQNICSGMDQAEIVECRLNERVNIWGPHV